MKKILSILLILSLLLSLNYGSVTVSAATSNSSKKITAREKTIVKQYLNCYEANSLSNMKKYIYPGSKISLEDLPETASIKILSPKYTKEYDSKLKRDYILISCLIVKVAEGKRLSVWTGTIGLN
jgi:hypothetical protein